MKKNIRITEAYLKWADKTQIIIRQKSIVIRIKKFLPLTLPQWVINPFHQYLRLIRILMMLEGETLKQCALNILKINFLIFVFLVINRSVHNVRYMDLIGNIKSKLREEQFQQSKKDWIKLTKVLQLKSEIWTIKRMNASNIFLLWLKQIRETIKWLRGNLLD